MLTCLVWFLAVALFLIYLVFNQRNDASNFEKIVSKSEREIRNTESAGMYLNKNIFKSLAKGITRCGHIERND